MDDPLCLWAQWLRAEGASDKTVSTRLSGIRSLCAHAGGVDPVSVTTLQIVDWLADHSNPWTRSTYAQTVWRWHAWLVERGLRGDNPTDGLRMPPKPHGVPRPASSQALDDALTIAQRRARAYILLAAFQGLRTYEIARVRGEDFVDGWLYVRGKGDDVDAVPVHELVQQLRRGWPAEGWWFPSHAAAGHVRPDSVSRTVAATFRKAGHRVTAHQLRHWFGTHALRISRDLRVAQELLRHRSVSSTEIYTQVAGRAKQETIRRLSNEH